MRALISVLLLFAAITAFAADKPEIAAEPSWLFKVTPDFLKQPDHKTISNGYYLELYDEQINLRNQTVYTHFIRKIVNESGVQNASEISVRFSPEYQQLTFHYIRVIRNGAVINHLHAKDIKVISEENYVADYQYTGRKKAFLLLRDIRKDDRIETAYSISGFNPVFNNKSTTIITMANNNPILNYYSTIITDSARKLNFTYLRNCPQATETVTDNSRVYHWNNPPISLWEAIPASPSWFDPYPSVTISEFNSWKEVVEWGLRLYNNYDHGIPPKLKIKIDQWRNQSKGDDDEFCRLALRFVQDEIRYLGLEIGVNTHKPHEPTEVFKNGYGDCKDKAALLVAILRSQQIQAFAALVNTSLRGELINSPPTPTAFDHVIVAVQKPGRFLYLDPTQTYQRGEINDVATAAYQYALLLKPGETDLRFVTPSENNIVRIFERLNVNLTDSSTLDVNSTYRGARADNIRGFLANTSVKDLEDAYKNYYAVTFDDIKLLNEIAYEDDTVYNVLKVNEAYQIPSIWIEEDSVLKYFQTSARPFYDELIDPSGISNEFPVALTFPAEIHYTLDIKMPEPWPLDTEEFIISNDSYEFAFQASNNGSLISLKYSLKTLKDHIPPAEVARYKKDYKKIADILQFKFTYGGNPAVSGAATGAGSQMFMILLSVLVAVGVSVALYLLNKRSMEVSYDRNSGHQLGGWALVLGFSLLVSLVMSAVGLFNGGYFTQGSYEIWRMYGVGFVLTVIIEMIFRITQLLTTLAITYWFIKRRDILPVMFYGYTLFIFLANIIMYVLYSQFAVSDIFKGTVNETVQQIVRVVIYGAIWCTYLARSERAKGTFIRSYANN